MITIKTTIDVEEGGEAKIKIETLNPDNERLNDSVLCGALLGCYIETAKKLIEKHECEECEADQCCFKKFNTEMIDAIEVSTRLHELGHKHEQHE